MCQDTGTAIVMGKRGQHVLTEGTDEARHQPRGLRRLHPPQPALLADGAGHDVGGANTGSNLPAQVELYADTAPGHETHVQVPLHGQGRRQREQVLPLPGDQGDPQPGRHDALPRREAPLASAPRPARRTTSPSSSAARAPSSPSRRRSTRAPKYLDQLPKSGDAATGHGFRDTELEEQVLELTRQFGIGAQFGGKYFCHDVRVVRLPRHGASPAGRHRRLVLGRPPGPRQDHPRGRVHRAARDRPRPLPPRADATTRPRGRRRGRQRRPAAARSSRST